MRRAGSRHLSVLDVLSLGCPYEQQGRENTEDHSQVHARAESRIQVHAVFDTVVGRTGLVADDVREERGRDDSGPVHKRIREEIDGLDQAQHRAGHSGWAR
jgi:hypothetical protein